MRATSSVATLCGLHSDLCVQVQYIVSVLFCTVDIQTHAPNQASSGPSLAAAMSEFPKRSLLPVGLTTVSV